MTMAQAKKRKQKVMKRTWDYGTGKTANKAESDEENLLV